jgi:hypothetical protein
MVAGAMSMAAGEYVSVSSQADSETADLERERQELAEDPEFETQELAAIYVGRGLEPDLARQVAQQLMAHDALGTHAREELGISEITTAQPVLAALTSAASFAIGAALPLTQFGVRGLSLTAEYRYLGTLEPRVNATAFSTNGTANRGKLEVENMNHSVLIGLRYAFNQPSPTPPPVTAPA